MNVFVLVADSMRYDHLGFCGADWIKTPRLDEFAKGGCVFDNAYSGGLPTLPQRTECFTGRYTLGFRGWQAVEAGDQLLAETLWDRGYDSALVTDVYHMHKPGMAFERGFDTVRFIRGQEGDPHIVDKSIQVNPLEHIKLRPEGDQWAKRNEQMREQMEIYMRNRAHWKGEEDHFVAQVVKEAISWLEPRKGRDNLFLWLDSFDPHEPWDPPAPFDRMYQPGYQGQDHWLQVGGEVAGYMTPADIANVQALYAGECSLVDKWLGVFLDRARELGFFDNTLIVFLSDHGEPLGDGKWGHGIVRKARSWPYEELAHVPLIVRHPQGLGAGRRSQAFAQPCDIAPTILDFLGVDGLPRRHGQSLLPLLKGEREAVRDFAVTGMHPRSWALRDDRWTYILWHGDKHGDLNRKPQGGFYRPPTPPELYDRVADRYELNDVAPAHPDVAAKLDRQLRIFMDSLA